MAQKGFTNKYSNFLIFTFLEIVAFGLTASHHSQTKAFWLNSANFLSSTIYNARYKAKSYFHLKEINDELLTENIKLKHKCQNKTYAPVTDSTETYLYTKAYVIKNSILSDNNFLTLNRGRKDGITKDMGVISPKGVVGVVVNTSAHFSIVLSILNKNAGIACKLKKNGFYGVAYWDGKNYRTMTLEGIPNHADVAVGDTIVTSGYSTYFPENILVGTIKKIDKEVENNFYSITISLSVDMKKLNEVYVVKKILQNEQRTLEDNTQQKLK